MDTVIDTRSLSKTFGGKKVVDRLNLSVPERGDLRLARRQRGRQDHHHPHADWPAARRRGLGATFWGKILGRHRAPCAAALPMFRNGPAITTG